MARGEREGDEQVFTFAGFRNDGPVADLIGPEATTSARGLAFARDDSVLHDAADFMRVGAVGTEADRVRCDLPAMRVMLGEHEVADHPPRLADVELMRPAAVVGELIPGQTEAFHVVAHLLRHARIGGEEMQQAAVVVLVVLRDFRPARVAGLGPFVARAGEVSAEGRRVEVPLLIRQFVVLGKPAQIHVIAICLARLDEARDDLVTLRIVIRRWCDGQSVRRCAQAETITIGLHTGRWFTGLAGFALIEQRQQSARGVAFHHIGIEWKVAVPHALAAFHAAVRAGLQMSGARLVGGGVVNAVVGLAILRVALAHERVAHSGLRHEIALVSRVDEHFRAKHRAVFGGQLGDARAILLHRREPCFEMNLHTRLARHVLEDLFRLVRLDGIRAARAVAAATLGRVRRVPHQLLSISRHQPREILPRDAASAARVADVHRAKAAARHAAEMFSRFRDHDLLAHSRRLHCCRDAARRAAVNADVRLHRRGLGKPRR